MDHQIVTTFLWCLLWLVTAATAYYMGKSHGYAEAMETFDDLHIFEETGDDR